MYETKEHGWYDEEKDRGFVPMSQEDREHGLALLKEIALACGDGTYKPNG